MTAEWDDLARLAEAASKATHGLPWVKDPDAPDKVLASKDGGWDGSLVATVASDDFDLVEEDVTEFIAAANPATILRLIEDNRRLRSDLDAEVDGRKRADVWREKANELAAKVAAVEALADDWEGSRNRLTYLVAVYLHECADDLRAALAAPTDTTKEN